MQDVTLVFCVEPRASFPDKDFASWVHDTFRHAEVRFNGTVLGCLNNTRQAFTAAFSAGARLAVMAEEDLVVSADVLEYLSWAAEQYEDTPEVAAVCAHVKDSKSTDPRAVVRVPWFNPLVCGTWRDRWEQLMEPHWRPWAEGMSGNQAWDNNLRHVLREAGKTSVFPALSRVLHTGETSTIYGSPVVCEYMYAQSISACFRPDYPPGRFAEVPFESVPGLLV